MKEVRTFLWRLKRLGFSEHDDSDLSVELESHLQMLAEDNLRAGMTPEAAQRAARIRLGGFESVRESAREQRGFPVLDSFLRDVRYSLRNMRRSPGFTVAAVLMLAVGIGINAAVFTVTNTVLFKGFPLVQGNDRIVYISGNGGMSWPDFVDWRAQSTSFEGMAAVADNPVTLTDTTGFSESYPGTRVSSNAFALTRVRPILGRDFVPADELPGTAPVLILSYSLWETRYGKSPAIAGQTTRVNGVPATIIGVMPAGFTFPQKQDVWMPLVPAPQMQNRGARSLWFAFARMKTGASIETANAEIQTIGRRLESEWPATNGKYIPTVRAFAQNFIGTTAPMLYGSLWAAVGFVLLIACANVANLLLARSVLRSREMSIRIAIGAGRSRIIRQLLIESLLLSIAAGAVGLVAANQAVHLYSVLDDQRAWFAGVVNYSVDYRVVVYLIAISIATSIAFGLAPALWLSSAGIGSALKDGARGATLGRSRNRLSSLLVAVEIALAIVLLAGGGVVTRSFLKMYTTDPGFNTSHMITVQVGLPASRYSTPEAQIGFFDRMQKRIEAVPGGQAVAVVDALPLYGSRRLPYELAGASETDEQRRPILSALSVSPSYFRTLGAAAIAGRDFSETDGISGAPVVIVNQRFAADHWPGENPVGKRLRIFSGIASGPWLTVCGVFSNIVQYGPSRPDFNALVYLPLRERPMTGGYVMARTRIAEASLISTVRREAQAVDPDLPISNVMPLKERISWTFGFNKTIAAMFVIFALVALLLASGGLYAVLAQSTSRRTQELGIRMAIGATSRDIRRLVFGQGMIPVALGVVAGLAISLGVNRLLISILVAVRPTDPVTYLSSVGVLILAAALGCWIPAQRAMHVDPAVALRHE